MARRSKPVLAPLIVALTAGVLCGEGPLHAKTDTHAEDMAGIEKLHNQDVAATLSGDPDALALLWTEDAVRLDQGRPADVGKKAVHEADVKGKAAHPDAQVVKYVPDIRDVTVRIPASTAQGKRRDLALFSCHVEHERVTAFTTIRLEILGRA